jgi:hypothetical protein
MEVIKHTLVGTSYKLTNAEIRRKKKATTHCKGSKSQCDAIKARRLKNKVAKQSRKVNRSK